jgi:hypothetical protein
LVGREEPRRRECSDGLSVGCVGERHEAGTQKLGQPAQEQTEVVAGGGAISKWSTGYQLEPRLPPRCVSSNHRTQVPTDALSANP